MYSTIDRIRELMKENDMKDIEMEDIEMEDFLEIPRGMFSNWKRGRSRTYYENIDRIADRLGVSIDYLVRGEEVESETLSGREIKLIVGFRELLEEGKELIEKTSDY